MEATFVNKTIVVDTQNIEVTQIKTYKKSDSKEFLSGVFYIIKKVLLIG